jgi:hypothetical protein
MVLWVSLFLYMRHKIMMLEERVALLSKLTTTVAGLTTQNGQEKVTFAEPKESEYEKQESEEENESEEQSESEEEEDEKDVDCEVVCDFSNQVVEREFPILKNILLSPCCMPMVHDLASISAVEISEPEPLSVPEMTEVLTEVLHESLEVDVDLPKRKISEDDVKTLVVNLDYESMSVKDLKEKVAEMGGPKLKTKKDLVEFLKNKI